jgi:hydroxyacylglutathione hydrolase
MAEKMIIQNLVLGNVATNCYFLMNPQTKDLLVVDPGDEADRIQEKIAALAGKPVAILLTHGHYDHMLAADAIRRKYEIPVYIHEKEEALLEDSMLNLSGYWSSSYSMKADHLVKEGDVLQLAGYEIQVLHTPGHTAGSACYYFPREKVLISGDTLFCQSYGRTDFPTSSPRDMQNSVGRLLKEIPEDVAVYPGHEMSTSIAMEKRYNPLA